MPENVKCNANKNYSGTNSDNLDINNNNLKFSVIGNISPINFQKMNSFWSNIVIQFYTKI